MNTTTLPSNPFDAPPINGAVPTRPGPASGSIDISAEQRPSFGRIVHTELRKMIDTVSGRTLVAATAAIGIGIQVIILIISSFNGSYVWAFSTYIEAGRVGLTFLLPAIVILSVTSEWTQRAALTTFTLVPDRARVIAAKFAAAMLATLTFFTLLIGFAALANLASGAINGWTTWDVDGREIATLALTFVFIAAMAFGFALVVLNSAGALVGYYIAALALPTLLMGLSVFGRIADVVVWIDPTAYTALRLDPSGSNWAHFAVSAAIWVVVPLAIGLRRVLNTEIK